MRTWYLNLLRKIIEEPNKHFKEEEN
uniref:Uncharacterized protein n=1 Tax=Rhizophora mucronata TaxID=61149 RepID=A0A2P2Q1B2_RHIMU